MTTMDPELREAIRNGVERSNRYDEIKTDTTEAAIKAIRDNPVIWNRRGEGWYHALTAEAWAILLALHDAGFEVQPIQSSSGESR
jgi:hypothetical protein